MFHVLEVGLQGHTDSDIFQWAQLNRCIIVTFDTDFTDRRNLGPGLHCGVILLRIRPTTIEQTRLALDRLLTETDEADLAGALVVVGRRNVRVRRPSESDE